MISPVPCGAPMVIVPVSPVLGPILVIPRLVPVALVNVRVVKLAFVEVTDVPVAVVNPKAPERVPPVSKR